MRSGKKSLDESSPPSRPDTSVPVSPTLPSSMEVVPQLLTLVHGLETNQRLSLIKLLQSGLPENLIGRTISDDESIEDKQNLFVVAYLANKGSVSKACLEVGIGYKTYQKWKGDPEFIGKLSFAKEMWTDELRYTAHLVALRGDPKLLTYLLDAYAPEEFDSQYKRQILVNKGQKELMNEMTRNVTREDMLRAMKEDPMVDYTDVEVWKDDESKSGSNEGERVEGESTPPPETTGDDKPL